jgi:hypothetical protein
LPRDDTTPELFLALGFDAQRVNLPPKSTVIRFRTIKGAAGPAFLENRAIPVQVSFPQAADPRV